MPFETRSRSGCVAVTLALLTLLATLGSASYAECDARSLERPYCWTPEGLPEQICRGRQNVDDWALHVESRIFRALQPDGVRREGPRLKIALEGDDARVELEDRYRTDYLKDGSSVPICGRCHGRARVATRLREGLPSRTGPSRPAAGRSAHRRGVPTIRPVPV